MVAKRGRWEALLPRFGMPGVLRIAFFEMLLNAQRFNEV